MKLDDLRTTQNIRLKGTGRLLPKARPAKVQRECAKSECAQMFVQKASTKYCINHR